MKVSLPVEASNTIKSIAKKISNANPYAAQIPSAITWAIVKDFEKNADSATLERVAANLISPKAEQKMILEKFKILAQRDIKRAQKLIQKLDRKLDFAETPLDAKQHEKGSI